MNGTAPVGGKYLVMLNMTSVKNETDNDWGSIGLMRNTSRSKHEALDYILDTMYYPNYFYWKSVRLGWFCYY